jgi:ABC-2 type transport system permease protein
VARLAALRWWSDGKDALALYLHLLGVSIRAQAQYRVSFALMTLGQFVVTGVEMLGVWALFARFGTLPPWTLPQVAFFYAVVNASFAWTDALARGFDLFGTRFVRTGNFDRLLLRPRTAVLQVAADEIVLARVGRLAQACLVFAWALPNLDVDWTWWRVLLLVFTLAATSLFFYGVLICQAVLSFWTTDTLEVINILTYGGVETAQYPMAIYERNFRRFFTLVVPLACVAYFPLVAVLGVRDPLGSSRAFQVCAPAAGWLFFAASLLLWRIAVRRYTSTGS